MDFSSSCSGSGSDSDFFTLGLSQLVGARGFFPASEHFFFAIFPLCGVSFYLPRSPQLGTPLPEPQPLESSPASLCWLLPLPLPSPSPLPLPLPLPFPLPLPSPLPLLPV